MDAQRLAQLLQMEQNRQAEHAKYLQNLPNAQSDYKPNYQNMPSTADYQPNYQYAQGGMTDQDRQFAQEQMNQPMQDRGMGMPVPMPSAPSNGLGSVPMGQFMPQQGAMGGQPVPMPTIGNMGPLSAQEMEYIRSLSR
jgi:hypothetical protein